MIKNKIYKRLICAMTLGVLLSGSFTGTFVNALNESNNTLEIEKIAGFFTGNSSEDGGAAEIVKYNKDNNKFYVINGIASKIHIVSIDGIKDGKSELKEEKTIDVKEFVEENGFVYGDITSISISNERKEIAVSVQEKSYNKDGKVVVVDYEGNLKEIYDCGIQPDMVTYTPNSQYILVANEGEPRHGYGEGIEDPQGTTTIIDINNKTSKLVTFEKFDENREQLLANKVILKKDAKPSEDLEPEYIAVDSESKLAYISLQENNAIATLDIEKGEFISVKGLGFKDHSQERNAIDVVKDGKINIKTEENLYGVYMPDGISLYELNGKKYILTANEGDGREYVVEDFPHIQEENQFKGIKSIKISGEKVDALDNSKHDGLEEDKNYILGGRSFSIWDAETMEQVFDSGSEFENIIADRLPEYFNCSNKNRTLDNRSGKKGPEAEEVRIGKAGDKVYAFIGIERVGGVMAYDITNPNEATFVNYTNTRDFSEDILGDVSSEGIDFISAENSETGYPLVVIANEVSGTVSVLEVKDGYVAPSDVINKEAAQVVINKINEIPNEVTLEDKNYILEVRNSYEKLTTEQKDLVSNVDKLINAENKIKELEKAEEEKNEDIKAAQKVEDLINTLPEKIKIEDKVKVEEARNAYNSLTEVQKKLVNNIDKLLKAEEEILKLENGQTNNEQNNTSTGKGESNKLPNTGGTSSTSTVLLGLLASIGGVSIYRKRK
ncbi:choice-of-anchor I family protein [Clostridium sp.]|uniref:choice-of-anchor I family protein n=1 Tax=Clostridium sp. TaxID=1506 RepID=UPI003F34C642